MKILTKNKITTLKKPDYYLKYFLSDYAKPLIVTFSPANILIDNKEADQQQSPWGFEFLLNENVNVLSFSCINKKNWYRSKELFSFLHKISIELDSFKIKLGYGSSMGGYAVGAFADLLNLDRVLLINPISTLNKELVPFETRFSKYANILDWNSDFKDGTIMNSSGYIVYDPIYTLDAQHAKRYCKNLVPLKAFGLGHNMPEHLKNLKILKWLVREFIYDTLDIDLFYKKIRTRRTLRRYYTWMLSDENVHLTDLRSYIIKNYAKKNGFTIKQAKKIEFDYNDFELIKKVAVLCENIHPNYSLELMKLLKKFRPEAPYVNKKILFYEQTIKKDKK
ncbi:MAG: hypothetical protein U9N59_13670 [Campylobacterota bacterium]|nr:hypothetical protein [Campylobacterota bacterium]